jgi:hypothetical protein
MDPWIEAVLEIEPEIMSLFDCLRALSYAGGAQNLANLLRGGRTDWRHAPPCRLCGKIPCMPCFWFGCNAPWKMGADFVKKSVFRKCSSTLRYTLKYTVLL